MRRVAFAAVFIVVVIAAFWWARAADSEARAIADKCRSNVPCLREELSLVFSQRGLNEVIDTIHELYKVDPEIRPLCTPLMRYVGDSLASTTQVGVRHPFTKRIAMCNYGIIQELPRAFLAGGGAFGAARALCMEVGEDVGKLVPDARSECFRGIGRGLPFVSHAHGAQNMASFAVQKCRDMSPGNQEFLYCISGAFNMLARESVEKNYGLEIDPEDPMWLCDAQPDDIRERCYGNWKWAAVADISDDSTLSDVPDITGGFAALEKRGSLSEATKEQVVWSLGYEAARTHIADESFDGYAAKECAALPRGLAAQCAAGYAVGLAKNGIPWEQHHRVFSFCGHIGTAASSISSFTCLLQPIDYLKGFYSPDESARLCDAMEKTFGITCDELPANEH